MQVSDHNKIVPFLMRHLRKVSPNQACVGPFLAEILDIDRDIFDELNDRCSEDDAGLGSPPSHIKDVLSDPRIRGKM